MISWNDWLQQHRATLNRETPYEWTFANLVLVRVPQLTPDAVALQQPFKDADGKPRRMDFAVLLPPGVKIAIEVDGYDKTGSGSGMTREQFCDFLLRQTSLAAQGWTVLRFDNAYFTRNPKRCVRQIELAVRTLSASSTARATPSEEELAELERLRAESNDVSALRRAVDEAEARAQAAENRAQVAERQTSASERTRKRVVTWSAAAVVIAGSGAAIYAHSRSDGQLGVPSNNGRCPAAAPIRGNRSQRTSERIYHVPGQRYYTSTTAIRCFKNEDQAAEAGYRKSKV